MRAMTLSRHSVDSRFAFRALVLLALVLASTASPTPARAAVVCFVDQDAAGTNNGTSWTNAYTDLQTALTGLCSEVWVAAGVYKPDDPISADRTISFEIPAGWVVLGGFDGTEDFDYERDPLVNLTILSGDIDNNDAVDGDGVTADDSDIVDSNSHHVVTMDGVSSDVTGTTQLDGFTITGGKADAAYPYNIGGGLLCDALGPGSVCSPTLGNLIFKGNYAVLLGGGIMIDASGGGTGSPELIDVVFSGNASGQDGGAMMNDGHTGGVSSPSLTRVLFHGNTAASKGGAVENDGSNGGTSNPTFEDATFTDNTAVGYGGAVHNDGWGGTNSPSFTRTVFDHNSSDNGGGAVYNTSGGSGASNPTFTDVTFSDNDATGFGGAVVNDASAALSSPTFNRVTFSLNTAATGGAVYNSVTTFGNSSPNFTNVTFESNSASGPGGAMVNHGGSGQSSPVLRNVTFTLNSASAGGGMYNSAVGGGISSPQLSNVVLWDDSSTAAGPEIYNSGGTPSISHSVIEGSGGSGGGWDTSLGTDGGGNLDADPALTVLNNYGGFTQTMALLAGSSAIDAGDDATCAAAPVNGFDQRGVTRPRGPACEIGAFERLPDPAAFSDAYRSDVVVYRGGAWNFYDFTSGLYLPGSSKWTGNPGSACIPAPMDYDGDGTKDFTQLCSGAWNFYADTGAFVKGIWVGNIAGLKPVPADYDGDNVDDVVVFNAGAWNKYDYGTGAYVSGVWTGNPGGVGVPSPMDYDGNGTADPTILSGGAWHFYNDNGSYNKGIWVGNVAGQLPVPGDYYGDGIDDVMVFRGGAWLPYDFATGAFLAAESVWTGNPAPPAGGGATKPAPIDYDGDGTLDMTFFAGGPWHFYNDNGSYNKGIWVGKNVLDKPISRRPLP